MTDKLAAARKKIDALDRRLAALLARRFALAASLKGLKEKTADPAREKLVLANVRGAAGAKIYADAAAAVFKEIIKRSRKLQA